MIKIGITGTIAAGKTTVSILLKRRGLPVFNTDNYARLILHKNNPCYPQIVKEFGEGILAEDGDIDRKKLAAVIFGDEEKRKKLNAISHPFVIEGMKRFFDRHSDQPLVFAEVPLLFEAHLEEYFDFVCVVSCKKETALRRMTEDRSYTPEEAQKRYDAQIDSMNQVEKADYVIYNDGGIKDLDQVINRWIGDLRKRNP